MPLFDFPDNGNWYLDVNGASKHFSDEEYNESNPGIGASYQWEEDDNIIRLIKLGQYLNSINNNSNYVGYGVKKRFGDTKGWHADVGALGGLITGYNSSAVPAILPQLTVGNGLFGLNMLFAPPVDGLTPATLMFSTEIPFK